MMFQPEHIDLIRAGEKTQTRRDWDDDYAGPSVGSVVMATPTTLGPIVGHADCDCYIRITRRWTEPLGAIATRSADAEGGYTVQGFKHLWEDINGEFDTELEVEVLEFEYVGYERPDSEFQTTIADGGRETVWIKGNNRSRGGPLILHVSPDCSRLNEAKNVYQKSRAVYPDDVRFCKVCSGVDIHRHREGPTGLWNQLEAMEPDDLVTDGGHLPSDPGPEAYPDPEDDPFACSICGAPLGESKRIRGEEHCDMCQREYGPVEYQGGR